MRRSKGVDLERLTKEREKGSRVSKVRVNKWIDHPHSFLLPTLDQFSSNRTYTEKKPSRWRTRLFTRVSLVFVIHCCSIFQGLFIEHDTNDFLLLDNGDKWKTMDTPVELFCCDRILLCSLHSFLVDGIRGVGRKKGFFSWHCPSNFTWYSRKRANSLALPCFYLLLV